MEYRRIVKLAREQLLTSAKAHFKSIINNRIANGVEYEITDWDEYPFYAIDLLDLIHRFGNQFCCCFRLYRNFVELVKHKGHRPGILFPISRFGACVTFNSLP